MFPMKISSLIALILFFFQSTAEMKGSIEGQVLRAGTDMPLSGVQVTLRQIPSASQPDPSASLVRVSAATDSNGKFVFPSLDPGSYAAYASSDGYAIQYYGVRGSGYAGIAAAGTPPSIKAVAGQSVTGITIHLTPTGVVSGRLTGPNGVPASGMRVALIPSYFDQTGGRATVLSAQGETDDRGQYRLFNAEPGRYYVTIQPTPNPDPAKREKWTVFYPGVEDFARAAVIEVNAGAELGESMFLCRRAGN
jgi:hypothetical protein